MRYWAVDVATVEEEIEYVNCERCQYWRPETIVKTPWGAQRRTEICMLRAQGDLEQLGKDHAKTCCFFTEVAK